TGRAFIQNLPPINRRPWEIPRAGVEMVIVTRSFRRQRRADRGDGRTRSIYGYGDGAAGEARRAPAVYGVLRFEAVGAGGVEVARLAAGSDVRALVAAGAAGAGTRTAARRRAG